MVKLRLNYENLNNFEEQIRQNMAEEFKSSQGQRKLRKFKIFE